MILKRIINQEKENISQDFKEIEAMNPCGFYEFIYLLDLVDKIINYQL